MWKIFIKKISNLNRGATCFRDTVKDIKNDWEVVLTIFIALNLAVCVLAVYLSNIVKKEDFSLPPTQVVVQLDSVDGKALNRLIGLFEEKKEVQANWQKETVNLVDPSR